MMSVLALQTDELQGASESAAEITLVLIDDNRLLREGFTALIQRQPGFRVLAASSQVADLMDELVAAPPHIVLLDAGLVDTDSVSAAEALHVAVPSARIVIMGLSVLHDDVATYVRAGAAGFIMKDASFAEFMATLRIVASGGQALPRELTQSLFTQIFSEEVVTDHAVIQESLRLTTREREIVDLLGEGLSNKEISARLHIAIHTVKSHVHNILEKLSLSSRLEIAAFSHGSGKPSG
jgi:DNA-binding NarL/FixJ family response regulator